MIAAHVGAAWIGEVPKVLEGVVIDGEIRRITIYKLADNGTISRWLTCFARSQYSSSSLPARSNIELESAARSQRKCQRKPQITILILLLP